MEKVGLKETMEILDGLKVLGVAAGKITADGKVDIADLVYLVEVAKNFDVLSLAVRDGDKAVEELKDLDESEIITLVGKVFEVVNAFKEAKKNVPTA